MAIQEIVPQVLTEEQKAQADAIAAQLVAEAEAKAKAEADAKKFDGYGRDTAERTIELNSHIAELASQFVDGQFGSEAYKALRAEYDGKTEPTTFDDSMAYIFYRGMTEIKRTWENTAKQKSAKAVNEKVKLYQEMTQMNPALIADPQFVQKMLAALADAQKVKTL